MSADPWVVGALSLLLPLAGLGLTLLFGRTRLRGSGT